MRFINRYDSFCEKFIGDVKDKVEIRIDLESTKHAVYRSDRHGVDNKITDDEIIDLVEKSIEELTIALMQDKLNIKETFVLSDKKTFLNVVGKLEPDKYNFRLIIITVIRKEDFKEDQGQFVLRV